MPFLLSFISSGGLKWLSILILVAGLAAGIYSQHRKIVDREKQVALQQYNINQLQQTLKDKDVYIKQMEDISKHKSEIVAELYIQNDALEAKIRPIIKMIEQSKPENKQSSKILKDTFKALGEMK